MRLKIPARELKHALSGLLKVIPRKSTLPILQGIRIEAAEDTVRLTATSLESTVYYACENASVLEPGICVIADARLLKKFIAKAGQDDAEITTVDEETIRLSLKNDAADDWVHRLPVGDFVDWPADPPGIATQKLDEPFVELYQKLVPFASTEESREVLNGVCLDVTNGKHALVATDGRRLAAFNSISLPIKKTCVIPTSKFLASVKVDGPCWLGVSKDSTRYQVDSGPWSVCGKVISGTYPNWRQVVPSGGGTNGFDLNESDLAVLEEAIRTLPISDTLHRPVTFSPHGDGTRLEAMDRKTSKWSYRDLIDTRFFGEATTVNRELLLDAVKAGFRSFRWSDANSPLISTTDTGTHVLMPVRGDKSPATTKDSKEEPKPSKPIESEKEKQPVIKPKDDVPPTADAGSVEQLWLSYQAVRDRVRELNTALSELGDQLRDAKKVDKTVRSELKNARGVLAKLQNIQI